jgi:hypothetical protein
MPAHRTRVDQDWGVGGQAVQLGQSSSAGNTAATDTATSPSPSLPSVKVGGAPTKYEWPGAAGYMAGYVVENDYPERQADLVRVVLDWFKERGRQPDSRDVERFVRAMYDARSKRSFPG